MEPPQKMDPLKGFETMCRLMEPDVNHTNAVGALAMEARAAVAPVIKLYMEQLAGAASTDQPVEDPPEEE